MTSKAGMLPIDDVIMQQDDSINCCWIHLYASVNWVSTGTENGLSFVGHQSSPWTNGALLSIVSLQSQFVCNMRAISSLNAFKLLEETTVEFCISNNTVVRLMKPTAVLPPPKRPDQDNAFCMQGIYRADFLRTAEILARKNCGWWSQLYFAMRVGWSEMSTGMKPTDSRTGLMKPTADNSVALAGALETDYARNGWI